MAGDVRPFEQLSDTGLLWLINRTTFHPRGFALALVVDEHGAAIGWEILGNGVDPYQYASDEAVRFRQAEATLKPSD